MPLPPPVPKLDLPRSHTGPIGKDDGQQFKAVKRLGRWPIGHVYDGTVLPDGAPCTIVFPDILGGEIEAWLADMGTGRVHNEALVGLPILSFVYAGVTVDHRAFAVLPHISGLTVADRVERGGPLSPVAALQVAVVLADAISRLHTRGRVLGELRPASIYLPRTREQSLRVVDLGLPRGLFARTISPPTLDPVYASAAVRSGRPPRPVDDIFALGAVLHFVLTGNDPPTELPPDVMVFPSRQVRLGLFGAFLDGIVSTALGARVAGRSERLGDMHKMARALRGLRDLHRLSPAAQQAVLALRPEGRSPRPPPTPGEKRPGGPELLGFIESRSTRDDLPLLLSDEALESIEALSSESGRRDDDELGGAGGAQ